MPGKHNNLGADVIGWVFGAASAPTAPTLWTVCLFTTPPTASTEGTEMTYSGYTRVAVAGLTGSSPNWDLVAGTNGTKVENSGDLLFGVSTATQQDVAGVGITSANTSTAPSNTNLLYWTGVTATTIAVGDQPKISAQDLQIAEVA